MSKLESIFGFMILAPLDWVVIVFFLGLFLWVGLRYKKKASGGLESFFLGGRNLPWFVAGTSMVATTFAADTPLAVTELVAKSGVSGNWLWWCFLSGGMLTTFFFAKYWRRANILTELELIDIRYSGKSAHFLRYFKAIYLGVFMNAMIIAWVNLAFVSILTIFLGFSESQALYTTFGVMCIAVLYSAASGLLGIAITDMIQFVIAMVGCILLAILVVSSEEVGGLSNLKSALPEDYFQFFPSFNSSSSASTLTLSFGAFFSYFAVQWWASWYPGAEPGGGGYVAQRMMSVKNEKGAVFSTLLFQIAHYGIRPWPWILVGLAAVYLYSGQYVDAPAEVTTLFTEKPRLGFVFTMRDFLPVGLKGLLFVAFLSAYLSTISTQLNWGASFVVNDFLKPLKFIKEGSNGVFYSRITTVGLMVVGVFVTTLIDSISGVWEFIMQCGAGLGLVLILRWYWWRINAWSEIVALVAPFIGMGISAWVLTPALGSWFSDQNGGFLFTVLFTTLAWILVTYLTPTTDNQKLNDFYQKVKPNGWWPHHGSAKRFDLLPLLGCWISSVVFVYSLLFSIGYFLFLEIIVGITWFAVGLLSLILLQQFMKKAGVR